LKTAAHICRILDANFNRAREGFRVCEEIARFILNEKKLTQQLKASRHKLSEILKELPPDARRHLLAARSVATDVGQDYSSLEARRSDLEELFSANIQRCKESLRVLEETSKCIDVDAPKKIKRIRFEAYAIEKRVVPKLVALRDNGRQKKKS
jgi:thiamine-phosphate pyrophosphorylase